MIVYNQNKVMYSKILKIFILIAVIGVVMRLLESSQTALNIASMFNKSINMVFLGNFMYIASCVTCLLLVS